MLTTDNKTILCESLSELPDLTHSEYLYLDFETTSRSDKLSSENPHHSCWIAGIGVTANDLDNAWYIPIGHRTEGRYKNLDHLDTLKWLEGIISTAKNWINHNVKYDAHVYLNCCAITRDKFIDKLPDNLIDTLTLAKLIDSDRFGYEPYALATLSKDWLAVDIRGFERRLKESISGLDYGSCPIDIMAEYCGQDVLTNRDLYHYICAKLPPQCNTVRDLEITLTKKLLKMERNGLRVIPAELKANHFLCLDRMTKLLQDLSKEVGFEFNPISPKDMYDVLINTYGLPVLKRGDITEKMAAKGQMEGNASFDAETMEKYAVHPLIPKDVIRGIMEVRSLSNLVGLFIENYIKFNKRETFNKQYVHLLHPDFNQMVRTGRMSCKQPNAQQLNIRAKKLIHPLSGYCFFDIDYSQIEFRIIADYIQDETAIAAYNENPDMDYHQAVADRCNVDRKSAKTINFLTAYGGGKRKLMQALLSIEEFINELVDEYGKENLQGNNLTKLAKIKSDRFHKQYHNEFPGLKETANDVAETCKRRGYLINKYGRHRKLNPNFAYRGFNSICQSSAADVLKEAVCRVDNMLIECYPNVLLNAVVHDSLLGQAPCQEIFETNLLYDIVSIMEKPSILGTNLNVPMRCSITVSDKSWGDCGQDERLNGLVEKGILIPVKNEGYVICQKT